MYVCCIEISPEFISNNKYDIYLIPLNYHKLKVNF